MTITRRIYNAAMNFAFNNTSCLWAWAVIAQGCGELTFKNMGTGVVINSFYTLVYNNNQLRVRYVNSGKGGDAGKYVSEKNDGPAQPTKQYLFNKLSESYQSRQTDEKIIKNMVNINTRPVEWVSAFLRANPDLEIIQEDIGHYIVDPNNSKKPGIRNIESVFSANEKYVSLSPDGKTVYGVNNGSGESVFKFLRQRYKIQTAKKRFKKIIGM